MSKPMFCVNELLDPKLVVKGVYIGLQEVDGIVIKNNMHELGKLTWFRGRESSTLIFGLGAKEKITLETIRRVAGIVAREVEQERLLELEINLCALSELPIYSQKYDFTVAFVEGWKLGAYRFDKYKSSNTKALKYCIHFVLEQNESIDLGEAIFEGYIRANGVMLARDLGNEPPNILFPEKVAECVTELFSGQPVDVRFFRGDELEKEEMNGLIAVGRGSVNHPPVMIEIRYCTDPTLPLIALVGKGITFDTGGINVKQVVNMSNMRIDMGGAAAVIGAMNILVRCGTKANVVALVAAAENGIDGNAMLPGEVIRYANGLTVQVGNTDAEGRLVLADGIIRANKLGANQIIDIATLTGACYNALGPCYAGVWGNKDIPNKLKQIGEENGEKVWELPLEESYAEWLKSSYADLCNIPSISYGSAITAALFLSRFADGDRSWAHIDMAGY